MSAAKAGNPVAQYVLGALYQQGDHVPADPALAVQWFSRAAEKGNLKAMHNLAIAYAQGVGTARDEAKAAEWFTRAAERGYVDSAFDLGVLYERGEGVPQDLKQAMKWYGIAAFAGDQPSKERVEFLKGQMKPADIKLASNAAMAFSPLPALEDANSL
jgi:localization factor PodJL